MSKSAASVEQVVMTRTPESPFTIKRLAILGISFPAQTTHSSVTMKSSENDTHYNAERTRLRYQGESFRRRRATLMKNARLLKSKCDADVYMVICRQGKYSMLNTSQDTAWPPSQHEVVRY